MRKLYVAIGVVVVLAAIAALAWMFVPALLQNTGPTTKITDSKQLSKTVLAFAALPYEDDYQTLRVGGYVDNLTKNRLGAVNLEVQLYAADGGKKETLRVVVRDVPPGQRRTYDVTAGTFKDPRTAKVRIVSADVVK